MYLLLLIFCTCSIIINADDSVDSDDEGKFIDLLPDDEKNAFIETVARRLLTGVKTKDSRYKSDEEVSDETLNQNNEFIQQVIQEESSNLRRDGETKIDSNEKLNVQGLKLDKQLNIHDNEDKNHIDLTLRSHRTKRNEKTVRNKEFIPVKTVYDEEPAETKTNTKNNGEKNEDQKAKSKEHVDENSTTEDIQVRGPRPNSSGLRQAETTHPDLQDSPNKATMIVNFEPEEITHDTSTEKEEKETFAVQDVTVSAENHDGVVSRQNGFTQPIFESEKSGNEGDISRSDEWVEPVNNTTSTTTKITKTETTEHRTTTTKNVITELITVKSELQNDTNKHKNLRNNQDDVGLEKDPKNLLGETISFTKTSSAKPDKEVKTSEDNIVMEDATVEINNDNLFSLSNDTNLPIEEKSNTSYKHDQETDSKSDAGNENGLFNRNITVGKDIVNFDTKNNTTTLDTALQTGDVESKTSSVDINQKDDEYNKAENVSETIKVVDGTAEQSGDHHKIKNKDSELKGSKQYAEFLPLKEINNLLTTTEKNMQVTTSEQYETKEVNSSYSLNNLPSIKGENNDKNINHIEMDSTELNHTQNNEVKDKILTTTEKTSSHRTHEVYYSKYVTDNSNEVSTKNHSDHDKENTNKKEGTYILNYKNQSETLTEITKVLRHRLLENNDQSEEIKPMLLKTSDKIKEYLVYEIPADEVPFVPIETKTTPEPEPKEQPYYVPVYNYAPSNAYYNAYNRLGPNDEDHDKIIENIQEKQGSDESIEVKSTESFYVNNLDGHRIFKYNSKKRKEKLKVIHNSNSFGLPIVIKKPKVTEIYFNPDEYLDMDYYFERSGKPEFRTRKERIHKSNWYKRAKLKKTHDEYFPDSLEEIHPYNSMAKNDVKNHINAVRQMLYEQKYFGFVPDRTLITSSSESSSDEHRVHGKKPHDGDHKHSKHSNEYLTKHNHENDYKYEDPNYNGNYNNTHENHNSHDSENANVHESKNNYRQGHKHKHGRDGKSFRAENRSDYLILLENSKKNSNKPSQRDISLDYYFGVHADDKRYEDVLRKSKDGENIDDNKLIFNKTLLHDLVTKIKRRRKITRKGGQDDNHQAKVEPVIEWQKVNIKARNKSAQSNRWRKNTSTIKELLYISNSRDVFPVLEKLMQLKLPLMRRTESGEEVEVYVNVLSDMVKMDNRALKKFDWLGSAVDVLGAVKKLKYLTKYQLSPDIHPMDLQLFKYVVYLYKTSKSALEDIEIEALRNNTKPTKPKKKKKMALPRNKRKKKEYLTKGLLNRVWLYIRDRNLTKNDMSSNDLDFSQFLNDLENSLIDLYTAIKHIALVTNYKRQQWFTNLKSLYLKNTENKEILEVLLHIFTTRLLELIENSANGVENGFIRYIEENVKDVERTRKEFVMILKVIRKIKELKY